MPMLPLVLHVLLAGAVQAPASLPPATDVRRDVPVPMRDGVVLRGDVYLPSSTGRHPTLVYRTPYGKVAAPGSWTTFARALRRGYAVVIQDVRGRYASAGDFEPYRHDGADGYDTIEWAARQPWSDGRVGTFGLSYPGAVQWLAAVERPPHLRAIVPAMTYARPDRFFSSGGVWDLSWLPWIWLNIAPDVRTRRRLAGPHTYREATEDWKSSGPRLLRARPLRGQPEIAAVAPWYDAWLAHDPGDPWWDWADLRGKYDRVNAAVLNISGWHDETYGPFGALSNFAALQSARGGDSSRAALVIGPWTHGDIRLGDTIVGARRMGAAAGVDYDALVLDFLDEHVRGRTAATRTPPVRAFIMGSNRWRTGTHWPLPGYGERALYLAHGGAGARGELLDAPPSAGAATSLLPSDPAHPVTDPHANSIGARDYAVLATRPDVLTFDSAPLERGLEVLGATRAEIDLSVDAPDTDLWVRLQDVAPDGTAWNLMSPGADVLRASYRNGTARRELLVPGQVYRLVLPFLVTGNCFLPGHRIRVQLSTAFAPAFSHNLHTGALETDSTRAVRATVTVHHGTEHPSRIVLPAGPACGGRDEAGRG